MIHLNEIKNNIIKKENIYLLTVIAIIFVLDRYSKIKIIQNFSDKTFYVNDFLNFDLTWNTGVGFGLFSSSSEIYYNLVSMIIAIVILFITLYILNSKKFDKIVFSIILGGALGNFYDRLFFKAVPDFIDFHYNNFHWFTFNFADIFITIGVILYLFKNLLFNDDRN